MFIRLKARTFVGPLEQRVLLVDILKFTEYVTHYKILTGNIFGLILKNKMAATGVFFVSHENSLYLPYYWSYMFGMVNQPIGNHGLRIF